MRSISLCKSIDVRYDVDVFVAGGGPAGVAAAVTAARQGASVYVAEAQACLGGMGTLGLVPGFCMMGDGVNVLAYGIGQEILDKMNREKAVKDEKYIRCVEFEPLKRVYDRLFLDAKVQFTFMTNVVDVIHSEGHVEAVICHSKSGFFAVKAKTYIDCTGDGDLCVMAGAKFEMGDETGLCMPGTLCSMWGDVDWDRYITFARSKIGIFNERLAQAFEDGVFSVKDLHHSGMWRIGLNSTGGNFGHGFGVDATDENSLTKALIDGRAALPEYVRFYREYIPGFEHASLLYSGALYGVRESRRIMGDYVLRSDDFLKRASFEDEIGRYCYPIDMHPSKPGDEALYKQFLEEFLKKYKYQPGESYGIPYRSLIPSANDNVLVAGRCVSCDHKMEGSIRVMPGCFITGQACGMAAAMAAANVCGTRDISVSQLQKKLHSLKA